MKPGREDAFALGIPLAEADGWFRKEGGSAER
jgi:hypothetical protein